VSPEKGNYPRIKPKHQHIELKKSSKPGKAVLEQQGELEKTIGRPNRHQIRPKFNSLLMLRLPKIAKSDANRYHFDLM